MKITLEVSNRMSAQHLADELRQNGLSAFAGQIEAQIPKPRIPEPGPWGVVRDSDGFEWVHVGATHSSAKEWRCTEDGSPVDWDFITEPTLIREGI